MEAIIHIIEELQTQMEISIQHEETSIERITAGTETRSNEVGQ